MSLISLKDLESLGTDSKAIKQLEKYISVLNKAYTYGTPQVSDAEYDQLRDHLEVICPESLVLSQVGASPESEMVNLPVWMGSLDKVKPETTTLTKFLTVMTESDYVITEKLDGISLLLERLGGHWRCYTRGNGTVGQDVTANLLSTINLAGLKYLKPETNILIRGEYILPRNSRDILKTEKNLRTIVSGLVNAKKPKQDILKYCKFVAYSLPKSGLAPSIQFQQLKDWGLEIPKLSTVESAFLDQSALGSILTSWRANSLYDIDGIVVAKDIWEAGKSGNNPKLTVAFKMMVSEDMVLTKVKDVEWNITKDGYLKPVVIVETVNIDGCQISRVTGNNAKFMVTNRIGPGALVNIVRSGQVIPKIVEVVTPANVSLPKVEHKFNETGADFIALDSSGNQAQLLQYFCKTLGIKYINTSICCHLVKHQIDTPEKMVAMSKETLMTLPNMGEKSATKIYNSIHETLSNASPLTLLVGLNILGRNIGMNRLQLVADCLGIQTFQLDMEPPTVTKLVDIDGFSDKLAKQLAEGFQNIKSYFNQSPVLNHYYNECLLIYQHLVDEKEGNSDNMAKPYTDFKVVFTGFRDKQLESIITKGGGVIGSAVNKTISHVVSKTSDAKCSGKIAQAQQLGIPTISRGELETLLGL